jgi:ribosomal protein L12E/L44/L45/RPP1/RPP2
MLYHNQEAKKIHLEDDKMKKVLSTIVAALVAVSFSGMVFAAEAIKTDTKTETTTTSPAGEVKVEKKEVKKSVKKHKRHHHKKAVKKDAVAPSAAPAEGAAIK